MSEETYIMTGIRFEVEANDEDDRRIILNFVRGDFERALSACRCPAHGKSVKAVTISGTNLDELRFAADLCCEEAEEAVWQILGAVDDGANS